MVLSGVSPISPNTTQLLKWGAAFGPLSLGTQPWRLLTATFVHGGLLHIALNMWCLWNLGVLAERIFGRATYLTLYLSCGLAGSVASLWWHPMVVGVGASGAIFGVAGGLITALYLGKLPFPKAAMQGTMRSLLIFAVFNLGFGQVAGGIDNSAHIGGFLAGLALGAGLAPTLTQPRSERRTWRISVFVIVALILTAATLYLRSKNSDVAQLLHDAEISLKQGDTKAAEVALNRASKLQPDSPLIQYELGEVYMRTSRFPEALKTFTTLAQHNHRFTRALVLLGQMEEAEAQHDAALAAFQQALQIDPANAPAEFGLAKVYTSKNLPSLATAASQKAHSMSQSQMASRQKPQSVPQ